MLERCAPRGANLGVSSGAEAVDAAIEPLEARGIIVVEADASASASGTCCATTPAGSTICSRRRRAARIDA